MKEVKLKEIAFIRASEKGNTWNVPLIPYRGEDIELLKEEVTTDHLADVFENVTNETGIDRYEYKGFKALNFVMYNAIDGGATKTLHKNRMWRSSEEPLLESIIEVPDDYEPPEVVDGSKIWSRE